MNTQDFDDSPVLRARLEALAERQSPATAVNIAAARQGGGRIRRRRIAGRFTAAAMVALACVLTYTALPSTVRTPGSAPVAAPPPLEAQKQSYPLAAGTDPVRISASFGWLPQGFTADSTFGVSAGQFGMTAQSKPVVLNVNVSHQADFRLYINTRNSLSPSMPISQVQQTTAETVRGRPATLTLGVDPEDYCVTSKVIEPPEDAQPTDPVGDLEWTLADGRQASLQSCLPLGIGWPDATAMLLHVAQAITVTQEPVAMPFYVNIGNIPSSMRVLMWDGAPGPLHGDNWSVSMWFGPNLMNVGFSILVIPLDAPNNAATVPESASCRTAVDALEVCVASGQADKPLPASLAGLGYEGLLDDIVVLGANPANWTTDVFR
jgi:hypothetical protein